MVWLAASQAAGKPAASSAADVKTEQPSKSTESKSDAAGSGVKQDTAAATGESAASTTEAVSGGKDETEDKSVKDTDSEEKMDTDNNDQKKTEEAKEEVSSFCT